MKPSESAFPVRCNAQAFASADHTQAVRLSMLDQYEDAKAKLAAIQTRWANYDGNNPEKFRSALREAREQLAAVELELKKGGHIEMTEAERLPAALDKAFPNARSKEIVTFEGTRFQRRFYPATRSNSGKSVRTWDKGWEIVG